MKKILALVFGCLMLFSTSAFGEGLDFSTLDLDELYLIRDRAIQEISLRLDEKSSISEVQLGEYVCGKHIKSGRYTFTNPDTSDMYRRVVVFMNQADKEEWNQLHQYNLKPNESAFIELEDDMILGIYDGVLLIEAASLPFELK